MSPTWILINMSIYSQILAITLQKQPFREDDCFFIFYTQKFGKLKVLAVGVRKIKSKMAGHLEPFGVVKISVALGYFKKRLTAAQSVLRFLNIIGDLKLVEIAGRCLNLVEELTKENHPEENIYQLILETLKILDEKPKAEKLAMVEGAFILKLLSFLGYRPELQQCLKCKNIIKPVENLFSFEAGGLVCHSCQAGFLGEKVSPEIIKLLRAAVKQSLNDFLKIKVSEQQVRDFNLIVNRFLEYQKL